MVIRSLIAVMASNPFTTMALIAVLTMHALVWSVAALEDDAIIARPPAHWPAHTTQLEVRHHAHPDLAPAPDQFGQWEL